MGPAPPRNHQRRGGRLDKVRDFVGGVDNKWGPIKLRVAGTREVDITDTLIFAVFLVEGLVPPFSSFLRAILEHLQVHTLHLHPNAVLVLAMFAHLDEAVIGVMSSLMGN